MHHSSRKWHILIIDGEVLLVVKVLILNVEAHVAHVLLRDGQLVGLLLVLGTVLLVHINARVHLVHCLVVRQ